MQRARCGQPAAIFRDIEDFTAPECDGSDDGPVLDIEDAILASVESGETVAPAWREGGAPEFEEPDADYFGPDAGVERLDSICLTRLVDSPGGQERARQLSACHQADEDDAHWHGPDGEELRAVVDGAVPPRIKVMRAVGPYNPVALFTPLSEHPYAAVAAADSDGARGRTAAALPP